MIKHAILDLSSESDGLDYYVDKETFKRIFLKLMNNQSVQFYSTFKFSTEEALDFLYAIKDQENIAPIVTDNFKLVRLMNAVERADNIKRVIVIDAHNFFHRLFHTMPKLSDSRGREVSILKAVASLLKKLIYTTNFTHIVFASEGRNLVRKGIYQEYKANRSKTDPSLIEQIKLAESVLSEELGITVLRKSGFEADDIIASIAKKYSDKQDFEIYAFSTDKDLNQLFVYENFRICDPKSFEILDRSYVKEKFGVEPEAFIDYQAIVGDSSDNVPGLKGFGPAAAKQLLERYGSIEGIYENLEKIGLEGKSNPTKAQLDSAKKKQSKIAEGIDSVYMSRELVTLKRGLLDNELVDKVLLSPMPNFEHEIFVQNVFKRYDINY